MTFTTFGTQVDTIHGATAEGCDSIVSLTVNVNPVLYGEHETTICDSELPYEFHGVTFTTFGTFFELSTDAERSFRSIPALIVPRYAKMERSCVNGTLRSVPKNVFSF